MNNLQIHRDLTNIEFDSFENALNVIELEINSISHEINEKNRFLNLYKIKSFIPKDLCKLIINESEKYADENGGWTRKRHKNYPTTDIPLCLITSIYGNVRNIIYKNILPKIRQLYDINGCCIYCADIFIVKYKHDEKNELEFHRDGYVISFNILLNSIDDFTGGGTEFEDGTICKLNMGDMLIHCGKILHSGKKIESGIRYILIGFLKLKTM
jgi:hypothetical protein